MLIQNNGLLYPIAIKKTATIQPQHLKAFNVLKSQAIQVGRGALVCFVDTLLPLNRELDAVPVGYV